MKKEGKEIVMEIVKSILYTLLGLLAGIVAASRLDMIVKVILVIGIVCILVVLTYLFMAGSGKKERSLYDKKSQGMQNARVNRNTTYPDKPNYSSRLSGGQMQNSQLQSSQMQNSQVQSSRPKENPLDRKPMSAEKRERREQNRVQASKIVLLNEEGRSLLEWSLQRKTSLIIGKSSDKEPVDIDLSVSAAAQMISKQHAVLNYTENGWYIDDIDSKNGTRVKKASQNAIMDVKLVGAVEVETGDIIYIANAMLQIQ